MSTAWIRIPAALLAGAVVVALSKCESAMPGSRTEATPALSVEDAQSLLAGTWLREYGEKGVRVRRVLSLEPAGTFHESARIVAADGQVVEHLHEGTWLYDGTNLKRKYTLMDGKPPSRLNVPFATFEIAFQSRNEFTGVDHIHGHRIAYRRVGDGTAP